MKKFLQAFLLLLIIPSTAYADPNLSITFSKDAANDTKASSIFLARTGESIRGSIGLLNSTDSGVMWVVQGQGTLYTKGNFKLYTGAAYLSETTGVNGTRPNFATSFAYRLNNTTSLELTHYSHAAFLGIAKDKSNAGWNLLGISVKF